MTEAHVKIKDEKHRLDVRQADLSVSRFDHVNARLEGATIDGVAVTDMLAYWQAGHGAKSA